MMKKIIKNGDEMTEEGVQPERERNFSFLYGYLFLGRPEKKSRGIILGEK